MIRITCRLLTIRLSNVLVQPLQEFVQNLIHNLLVEPKGRAYNVKPVFAYWHEE